MRQRNGTVMPGRIRCRSRRSEETAGTAAGFRRSGPHIPENRPTVSEGLRSAAFLTYNKSVSNGLIWNSEEVFAVKRVSSKLLLAALAGSAVVYAGILFWDVPMALSGWQTSLILTFSAVPFFCLQCLLCRLPRARFLRFVPLGLLTAMVVLGFVYLTGIVGSGWDALGGALLLLGAMAPATGCALAWIAQGAKLPQILGTAGLVILLIIYAVLKVMGGGPVFCLEPIDILVLLFPLAALLLFLWKRKPVAS